MVHPLPPPDLGRDWGQLANHSPSEAGKGNSLESGGEGGAANPHALGTTFTFLCFLGQEEINREPKAEEPFTLGQKGCVHKKVSAIRPGTLPRSALPRLLGLPAVALRAPVTVLILLMEIWEQQHRTWGETGGGK